MSLLNIKKLEDIEQMTLSEYYYRMYALEFETLQKIHDQYNFAFAMRNVKATKNVGTDKKPKEEYRFKSVKDVIDFEKNYKRLKQGEQIIFEGEMDKIEPPQNDLKAQLKALAKINNSNEEVE